MRCTLLVVVAACGSKSEPAAPTATTPPLPSAPVAKPAVAEAPGPGPWMKLTDGGGLVLSNPGRWVCATITGGAREDSPVSRASCTLPITEVDTDLLTCPDTHRGDKVTYDAAGHATSVGAQLTWNGDTLATRGGDPVTIERTADRMTLHYGGYTTLVDTDAQGRIARSRTWVGDNVRRPPDAATIYAYAGDEVVSVVHSVFHLPVTELAHRDLVSCATAASPAPRARAPMPTAPLGIATSRACLDLADHVAQLDLPAASDEEIAKHARGVAEACRAWAPAMRTCLSRAKTGEQRHACPLLLAPVGPPRPCEAIADHEVALATVALKGQLTVEDAAARRALVLGDCTRDGWTEEQRGCTAAATDHAMFLECLRS